MIRVFLLLAFLWPGLALAYENPLFGPINDPDCVVLDGRFHLITPAGVGDKAGFDYRWSKDLLHWSAPERILAQSAGTQLWQGYYYRDASGLYLYSAQVTNKQKAIHVGRADSVTGPFTDLGGFAPGGIDPFPLADANGTLWLYYKDDRKGQKGIWAQKMADPATPQGAPVEVLHPEPGTFEDNGYLTVEGPMVIARGGHYFLIYSGGPFDQPYYTVGYAVSDSPSGPFTRKGVLLAPSDSVFSPGVPDVVTDGAGQDWLVYRQRTSAAKAAPRVLTIDRLDTSQAAKGLLSAVATSGTVQPDPVPLK